MSAETRRWTTRTAQWDQR